MSVSAACAIGALILRSSLLQPQPPSLTVVEVARPSASDYGQVALGDAREMFADARPANIFVACPALVGELPDGVMHATPRDREDSSRPIPPPGGPAPRSVVLWNIDAPVLSAGRRGAVVLVTWSCPGLCGGGQALRFRYRHGRWAAYGGARPLWSV